MPEKPSTLPIIMSDLSPHAKIARIFLPDFDRLFQLRDKRLIEKKAAAYLVQSVLKDPELCILYRANGRPYLNRAAVHISISHSFDWLVVLFSSQDPAIGIDVEKVRDKILRIRHKFLSDREAMCIPDLDLEKLTL